MPRTPRTLAATLLTATLALTTLAAAPATAAPEPAHTPGSCSNPGPDTTPGASGNPGADTNPGSDTGSMPGFAPVITPGKIIHNSNGDVLITNPSSGDRDTWGDIGHFPADGDAEEVADGLNDAMASAEKDYDKKGKGDTSPTDDNKHFKVDKVGTQFVVNGPGGRTVAKYDDEKKANAVANALEAELEEQLENKGADPCHDMPTIEDLEREERGEQLGR